jgi:hypothetical protein
VLANWDVVTIILIVNEADFDRPVGLRTARRRAVPPCGTGTIAESIGNEGRVEGMTLDASKGRAQSRRGNE